MSEKFPSKEDFSAPSKHEVISSLQKNPEDLSVLHSFLDKREGQVRTSKEALLLNVEVAEIYRDAGLIEAARQAFADAADQAWQEEEAETYEALMAELKNFGS
jgi:hypothetical protein